MHVKAAVTVNRPREQVYAFWRNFENFPRFMVHVESVERTGAGRYRWAATAPGGRVEWEAEVVEDTPDEVVAWRSIEGDVPTAGSVRFVDAPGGRGTEVRVELRYDPPAGGVADAVAKLFGEQPEQQVKDDLRRFKQVLETGEVVVSDATPEGITAARQLRQKPAQPGHEP